VTTPFERFIKHDIPHEPNPAAVGPDDLRLCWMLAQAARDRGRAGLAIVAKITNGFTAGAPPDFAHDAVGHPLALAAATVEWLARYAVLLGDQEIGKGPDGTPLTFEAILPVLFRLRVEAIRAEREGGEASHA
jgi:hypothetical protein